jgi:hypothetical protein
MLLGGAAPPAGRRPLLRAPAPPLPPPPPLPAAAPAAAAGAVAFVGAHSRGARFPGCCSRGCRLPGCRPDLPARVEVQAPRGCTVRLPALMRGRCAPQAARIASGNCMRAAPQPLGAARSRPCGERQRVTGWRSERSWQARLRQQSGPAFARPRRTLSPCKSCCSSWAAAGSPRSGAPARAGPGMQVPRRRGACSGLPGTRYGRGTQSPCCVPQHRCRRMLTLAAPACAAARSSVRRAAPASGRGPIARPAQMAQVGNRET